MSEPISTEAQSLLFTELLDLVYGAPCRIGAVGCHEARVELNRRFPREAARETWDSDERRAWFDTLEPGAPVEVLVVAREGDTWMRAKFVHRVEGVKQGERRAIVVGPAGGALDVHISMLRPVSDTSVAEIANLLNAKDANISHLRSIIERWEGEHYQELAAKDAELADFRREIDHLRKVANASLEGIESIARVLCPDALKVGCSISNDIAPACLAAIEALKSPSSAEKTIAELKEALDASLRARAEDGKELANISTALQAERELRDDRETRILELEADLQKARIKGVLRLPPEVFERFPLPWSVGTLVGSIMDAKGRHVWQENLVAAAIVAAIIDAVNAQVPRV